jgi:hypothetical protein
MNDHHFSYITKLEKSPWFQSKNTIHHRLLHHNRTLISNNKIHTCLGNLMNKINVMHVYGSRHIYCVIVSSEHIFTLCVSVKLFKSFFCSVKPFKCINQCLLIYYFINTKLKLIWWDLPIFHANCIQVCLQASIGINLVWMLVFWFVYGYDIDCHYIFSCSYWGYMNKC